MTLSRPPGLDGLNCTSMKQQALQATRLVPLFSHTCRSRTLFSGARTLSSFSSPVLPSVLSTTRPFLADTRTIRLEQTWNLVRNCSYQHIVTRQSDEHIPASMDVTEGREVLPKHVRPLHYDVTLEPDFENFSYEGTVKIEYVTLVSLVLFKTLPSSPATGSCDELT